MARWTRFIRQPPVSALRKSPASRWPLVIGTILAIWLGYLLYAGTLSLPYLQEDSTHLRWLSWHSLLEPFFSARGAPDYRPLGKSIIKAWYLLLGHHDRAWLHFHNVAFNSLNTALVALLASWADTSKRRYFTAGIAALLFGTFPFAYQAIPWINNFFYPLANLLLLLMTVVYWQARVRHSRALLALAFLFLFLAPFQIEYGLMGSALLFVVELVLWLQRRQPYPWLTGPLLGLALNLLFLFRSLTIPKQSYSFGAPTPERLLLISTYFLQGLMYPIAPLALRVMDYTGWGDVAAIWLVCLPALLLLIALLVRRGQLPLLALSLLWFVLLNLPALVFVDFDYVVNSPRLLYPPAVGIVMLWGGFLAVLARGGAARPLRLAGTMLLLIVILAASIAFVERRNMLYKLAERPVLQLAESARQASPDETLLVVNFPSWISPQERTFAMGNHGVQIIPFYINIQELIYAHNEADQPAQAVQFANIRQPQPYYYGMLGEHVDYEKLSGYLQGAGRVFVTQWNPEQIELAPAGEITSEPGKPIASDFRFDNGVRLTLREHKSGPDHVRLTLQWEITETPEQDVTAFVHLYGPDGELVTQADGYPLLGIAPFWLWPPGLLLLDERVLSFPAGAGSGPYTVGVGLYDVATGERIPVTNAGGVSQVDHVARMLQLER